MSEEQARLVRFRLDSESSARAGSFGSIETNMPYAHDSLTSPEVTGDLGAVLNTSTNDHQDNDSGELLDFNEADVLEQFHADALAQAGFGTIQLRVIIACMLAVIGASMELASIPFILPSAEIELCIRPHEKNWLVLISLVGSWSGAALWGALGSAVGRRRALLSCLAVNALFAAVAAFMPTYGTFMMARFCSAIGSGGILGLSLVYLYEAAGVRGVGAGAAGRAGAGLAAALALHLPAGPAALHHSHHWHRYMVYCMVPVLCSLASLVWAPESPRYLLQASREMEALTIYQNMHSSKQIKLCGKSKSNGRSAYRLGELTLPAKRRPSTVPPHSTVRTIWESFFQLFSSTYRKTTLSLGATLVFSLTIQFLLSSYVPAVVDQMHSEVFALSTEQIANVSIRNEHYNRTFENIHFTNVTFTNCTFRDLLMSHVAFRNCTFNEAQFANIRTSHTAFAGCHFVNNTILDSDIEVGRELDEWCVLNNTIIKGMQAGCNRHADLAFNLQPMITHQSYAAQGMLLGALLTVLPSKFRPTVILTSSLVLLSPSIYLAQSETALYIIEAVYNVIISLIFFDISVTILAVFPASIRCTCLGMIISAWYMLCGIIRAVSFGALVAAILTAILGLAATVPLRYRPPQNKN